MIGALLGAVAQGVGFGAGASYVANHSGPAVTLPYWQGTVNGTTLALTITRWHTQVSYGLHIIAGGGAYPAGSWPAYPQALAAIQAWTEYLTNGGSVMRWLANMPEPAPLPWQKAIGRGSVA